ncbi:MAG TPA: KUP/HAK/KT family potassium transporter [Candidatus Cybelea sp.]|jgi:KUP system potassium uptake protein|nr:KUP/HAK/KT family potassium transporter [Candidatus Cybelea sp.]
MGDKAHRPLGAALALGALGIVFGDIGTSPLYAFRQCFAGLLMVAPTHENVLGLLSLILWSLILIVFVRYIGMVMRIAHGGEGGILALLAFILPPVKRGVPPKATWLTFLIILGAGMLFGDGIITPAVSVLSSVEGLRVATSDAQPYIVPIAAGILVALFVVQNRGTGRIGSVFGPIMLAWFVTIGLLGVLGIAKYPAALWAFNPWYIVRFFAHHGVAGLTVFGAIVLCVSGVEALYADMSHFGRAPIALAWTVVVFPALVLNYLGQGALVLAQPASLENPFYRLAPSWALYPVVAIATVATIIASQALISGVFTLTKQGISLGFIPRMRVIYTSLAHRGQVYVPFVNRLLAVICILLVVTFQSSARLANAYGLAVAATMVVTSIAYFEVVRVRFRWSLSAALLSTVPFLAVEILFVIGSLPKVLEGGWIPLVVSAAIFVIAGSWRAGKRRVAIVQREQSQPVSDFLREVQGRLGVPYQGTAVFLTGDPQGIPFVLRHHWARTHSIDEKIVLLTIIPSTEPYVRGERRVEVEWLSEGLVRVTASFGFMEKLDIARITHACAAAGLHIGGEDTTYYSADPQIIAEGGGVFHAFWRGLYVVLRRNARSVTSSLGIPPDALARLGIEVRM